MRRPLRFFRSGTCAVLAALPALAAEGPVALDCAQAAGKVPLAVCGEASLAALDRKVEAAYRTALAKGVRTAETVEAEQRGFVQQRDACERQRDVRACLQVVYTARVSELQAIHGLVPVTGRARFACAGEGPPQIEATFFASEAPSALLTAGTREVLLLQTPSASGAAYEGEGVVFWNEGDEARVTWEEIELQCKVAR
jgi:uncharacterized protein